MTERQKDPGAGRRQVEQGAAPPGGRSVARREMGEADIPSTGLLSFYDRLRRRVLEAVERKGGKLGAASVRALLLVPDVFMLLVRLALDREVPGPTRALIASTLVYFIVPTDLLPEAIVGAVGYLDDLVLASAVLAHALGGELEAYARKYWSGPEELRVVLRDVSQAAHALLGENLYRRVTGVLERRGIRIEGEGRGGEAPGGDRGSRPL